jgi:hypothetical protein
MDEYGMNADRNKPGRDVCINATLFATNSTSTAANANKRNTKRHTD